MYTFRPLSPLAKLLLESFEEEQAIRHEEKKITVNPIVSKFASWYERLRNAMEYREDEVILRATIERILKRRLLLGGNGQTTAESLVKELLWARYLPDNEISVSMVKQVEQSIDLYLNLRLLVLKEHRFSDTIMNEWIYDLMSSDIQYLLNPKHDKETMTNFMFHVLKDDVEITDDSEETKNAQVFMAVRRAYSRDDLAFLRYNLFTQYFGKLTDRTLSNTAKNFPKGYREILRELNYPIKDRIYTYVKRRTAAFLILEDVLAAHKDDLKSILESEEALGRVAYDACTVRYNGIAVKVRTAIIRSVIFILFTKLAFAFFVEGTYDKIVYGHIMWPTLIINIAVPPLLMIIVGLLILPPGLDNSQRILTYIYQLLYAENPQLGDRLVTAKVQKRDNTSQTVYNALWLLAFILSFGIIIYILTKLHFNVISQFVFLFFLTIVSFLSYRISLIANTYRVGENQGVLTLVVDFLFMPVIRVGRQLTQNIARINIFLMLFDFFIEAPFKSLFAFFDQWFYYLHAKTEELE